MRAVSPEIDSPKVRVGSRPGSRFERLRKSRLRNVVLEWLESRQLLSTVPTPIVTTQVNISRSNGNSNDSTPSIAIDPTNPQHMVSAWTHYDTSQQGNPPFPQSYVEAAYSTNGGTTWLPLGSVSRTIGDFTSTATPQPVFAQGTDASVGFDRSGDFYILSSQHTADSSSGELLLQKYSLIGNTLTRILNNEPVYVWNGDGVLKPTMAVDNNLASFTDGGGTTQTDPNTGNIYIAWESNDATPPNTGNWNPNTIRAMVSSNGGVTFSGYTTLSNGGNFGNQRMGAPRLTISQGGPGVPGGQVTVVWDDFGSFVNASPTPLDAIDVNRLTGTLASQQFNGGPVSYGAAAAATAPVVTPITVVVAPSSNFTVTDLSVRLAIAQADVNNISVTLTSPTGVVVPLIAVTAVTGSGFGTVSPALLDSNAPRALAQGAAPYTGTFRPSGNLAAFDGQSSASLAGNWTITVSNISTTNGGTVSTAAVVLTGGLAGTGQSTVALVDVRGAAGNAYPTASAANPFGIGPDPSLASNNTVGSFSPYQGWIYLTYVDRYDSNIPAYAGNPSDNTDIFMVASSNGGASWFVPQTGAPFPSFSRGFNGELVNNDNAQTDGYSEAAGTGGTSGRAQFQPSIAVDQGTGALVISYYDGRYDAARARVAQTVAVSIDGGASFAQTYVNATYTVINEATGTTLSTPASALAVNPILPILDNESAGNTAPNADRTLFGFGDHQGLAVVNGMIYPVWSSNQNGGSNGRELLNIWTAPTEYAVGPRIIGGSSGPIGLDLNGNTLDPNNTTTTADGTPILSKFTVTFDRPIDPASFTIASVVVHYEDVNGVVTNIVPLSVVAQGSTAFGATTFLITFTPQSGVGTYSYEILPTAITDRIPTVPPTPGVISGSLMDQNGNATPGQATDFFAMPTPTGNTAFSAPYNPQTLPLSIPGPHLVNTFSTASGAVAGAADNLVLNGTVSSIDVTFDRNMNPATISGADVLRIQGPAGLVNGLFTMVPDPTAAPASNPDPAYPRTYKITFPTQFLSGTYTVTLASSITSESGYALDTNMNAGIDKLRGTTSSTPVPLVVSANDTPKVIQPGQTLTSTITLNQDFVIQNETLQLNITYPNDPNLTATLIAPDGTQIVLFSNLAPSGGTANFTNTIFDDTASTPIGNGSAPYTGRFIAADPLGVLTGSSALNGPTGTPINGAGVYTLQITNSGTQSGSLNGWSMTLGQPNSNTGLGQGVADRAQASFRIFTMDPTNPQSSTTWTSVGPASVSGSNSGRVGGIAVDPSDPSGNTVYVAGASGGVWKTNDFLTTSPQGPTWIPLTDFGAALGVNTGGIAVFGRNHDPNQSIIFVATGEGDTGTSGVGFLRSMDGGATWTLLDSTNNTLPYTSRDHWFVGTTSFDIMVDPNPTPSGNVVVYAALGGAHGGVWRSTDSGATWGILDPTTGIRGPNLAIPGSGGIPLPVTSLAFEANSGTPSVNNPTGNLQVLYAAVEGSGVYISPNQGQVWNLMAGGVGDPLIHDSVTQSSIPVNQPGSNSPNGASGRIVLVAPALLPSTAPNATLQNFIYQNWLYALVVTTDGNLQGLYLTKDQGQNWTQVRIATLPTAGGPGVFTRLAVPTNNISQPDYNVLGGLGGFAAQGNYDVSLGIDPTNPNIVYLGGTADGNQSGFLRVDVTGLNDPHALYQSSTLNDGGTLTVNSAGAISLQNPGNGISTNPEINLIRNPANPLGGAATFTVGNNMGTFQNSGAGATWIPFDGATGFTDQHRIVTIVDPLTGLSRIITGDDQGIFSAVDNNGTISSGIGNAALPGNSRNGNLQITQFYYGASQPSSAAAQIAGALLYGSAQDDGTPSSSSNVLTNGNIFWNGPTGDATGVATDQTGSGTHYQYLWPCCGGGGTDFFQVNGVGRTNGLIQSSNPGLTPDPQWPLVAGFNFAVNPINGNQIIMGSGAGRLFRTEDQGQNWLVIANPITFDGTTIPASAFGAPDPVTGGGSLDNFIYAGTAGGHMYVTFTGGGATGNSWYNISQGLDGSTIHSIVTDPTRGSYDAYAVTSNGVYYMPNALAAATNPAVVWQNITGNLFGLKNDPFGDPSLAQQWIVSLSSIQADWRYLIPDNPSAPSGPSHPVLYVGGQGGVFYSLNQGTTWQPFPNTVANSFQGQLPYQSNTNNGYNAGMPLATVSDLGMSIGNIDPTTGHAVIAAGDPNALLATTYGSGVFAIRLAPFVIPNTQAFGSHPDNLYLDPSVSPVITQPLGQQSTASMTPVIDGTSEQSAYGNTVTIQLYDLTAVLSGTAANPVPIPLSGTVTTDGNGHFQITVAPGYFTQPGLYTVGVQAVDQTGAKGNMAMFTFIIGSASNLVSPINLDPSTDSGSSSTDQYTSFNNSTPATAPLLDVSGISTPVGTGKTTVVLLRATMTNGLLGSFVQVNQQAYTASQIINGVVSIADTNGGNGTIADTPVNTLIDTAPNQPNMYLYAAYQIDYQGNVGNQFDATKGVIIDTVNPAPPTKVVLDPSTDSGTSNGDSYTNFNNSKSNPPLFDVTGLEPNAGVELIRTDSLGNQVIVNTILNVGPNVTPTTVVQIADTNVTGATIPDSPVGSPPNTAPPAGNPYTYTAIQIDLAGNKSLPSAGDKVIIDTTPPAASTIGLDPSTDSGSLNNDQFTNFNNSTPTNAPLFDVTGVEPNGIVALYRTPGTVNGSGVFTATGPAVLVNTVTQAAVATIGTIQVADINAGGGAIPNGDYLYTTQQTDLAGNVGPISVGQVVLVTNAAPPAPTSIVLDPSTDSGTFNNDQYTNFNNSTPTKAPLLDVFGVITPPTTPAGEYTTVVLLRAAEVNGVVGTFSVVNTQTYSAAQITSGEVQIADLNGGNGAIPDTPVNTPADTAPNQPNQYVYQAYQTDYIGNSSAQYTTPNGVIIDSTAPAPPTKVVLDPSTDSGTSNGDSYTNFNNSKSNPPLFDVSGIEPHATVELIRTDSSGNQTIVNIVQNVTPTGPNNTVQIADINGNNTTIPDSPVGSPPDTAPPSGNPYTYTAIQIDLAGNPSGQSTPTFGNKGAIVLDGTDANNHGFFSGGANQQGWLYMQKVLDAIQPNITSSSKVLVALGVDPSLGSGAPGNLFGATGAIYSAFTQSVLPSLGWKLDYVTGNTNIDNFLNGKSVAALNNLDAAAGLISIGQTGFLYITTFNHTGDDLTSAELQTVDNHGLDILSYVNTGGGLYTQAESPVSLFGGGFPTSYGWLSALFPGITAVGVGSEPPFNIQLTTSGQAIFPGLTNADLSGGPWHNYFGGTIPSSLTPLFTDTNPKDLGNPSDTVVLGLSSVGSLNTVTTGDQVIIDSTPPAQSTVSLDPSTDSGTFSTDQLTNFNNSAANPPLFDVTGVEPNAILKLYRVPGTYAGGVFTPTGAPGLVNTTTEPSNATIQGGTITDTNAGNGTIADGTYLYYITQTDLAGNVSVQSLGAPNSTTLDGTGVVVQIDATAPVAPRPFQLDPASDTGTFNNDNYTKDNNGNPYPAPVFDLYGIEANATVKLYRATIVNGIPTGAVLVNTLVDVTPTGPNNLIQVPDINGGNGVIADGVYAYTAKQIDLAGNVGPSSNTATVTINTAVPKPSPLPAPALEPASDTGLPYHPNVTQDNNGNPYPAPIFDVGTVIQPVDQAATVQLWRAPVVGGVIGAPILVDTLTNVAGGVIPIADTNAGNGKIADGTYDYYARLVSLSGVPSNGITVGGVSGLSTALTVVINATPPALATSLRLDPSSDTGVSNSDGVTRITINQHPLFDVTGILPGATVNLYRAPVAGGVTGAATLVSTLYNVVPTGATNLVKISDATVIPDGQYVYTVQQIDSAGNIGPIGVATIAPGYPNDIIYDTAQPAIPTKPVLDPASDTGTKGDNATSNTSPFLDVSVSVPGFEQKSQLSLVRDGVVVATTAYNVTASPVVIQDPGPVPFGAHTYQAFLTDLAGNVSPLSPAVTITFANDAPGTMTLDPGSDSGVKGDNLTNVTKPTFDVASVAANSTLRLLRNGLVVATVPTGAGGTVTITDPGPLTSGVYTYTSQVVDSKGNASPPGPPLVITIDLVLPGAPSGFVLDPASDSGLKGDDLTNVNNPTFDAAGVVPGATVNLYRNGTVVASLVSTTGGAITITDPGPVPDGTYTYLVQQVTRAGNVSPNSVQVILTIQTAIPATPSLVLDPASDSGNKGDNITNVTSPYFDASGVVPGSTLSLYRNGLNVNTLTNVVLNTNGQVLIQDPGPLTNGNYTYTAQQTTLAGNTSVLGAGLTITINTAPPVIPTTPVLNLDPSTDTGIKGDNITSARQPKIDGTADPAVVVTLLDGKGNTLGVTTSDALGNFSFSIPQSLTDGSYNYQAYATNTLGIKSPTSQVLTIHIITVAGDFNGNGATDVAVFRRTQPYLAQWFAANTLGMATGLAFGAGILDVPVTGDFTGSGKTDPAVYRPSTATWYIAAPPTYATLAPIPFGWAGVDVPVPANYSGSGITQIAVYRPPTGQWFVQGGANPYPALVSPALSTDIPVPANYNNTGKAEFAVYRPTTGTWYINGPSGVYTVNFDPGGPGGIPVPGAYDASVTSQTAEPSIFNPTTGQWFIQTATGTRTLQFNPGDVPVPGDYEGTGITEPVVYRPSTGQWWVESLTDTAPRLLASYGWAGKDIPVLSPYRYRALGGGVNAGTNGTITAASLPSLDLAASALGLSSTIAPATTATFNKAATPTAPVRSMNTIRVRPAQAHEPAAPHQSGQETGHLVDHALASLVKVRAHRKARA